MYVDLENFYCFVILFYFEYNFEMSIFFYSNVVYNFFLLWWAGSDSF